MSNRRSNQSRTIRGNYDLRSRPYNRNSRSNTASLRAPDGTLRQSIDRIPHNNEKPSPNRSGAGGTEDERLNFSRIDKISCDSKTASFNVEFAHNREEAVVTFQRGPSYRNWEHYSQENFFTDFQIGNRISTSRASTMYSCTLPPRFNPWTMRISNSGESEAQAKKEEDKKHLIYETYELYKQITGPHVKSHRSDVEWIDNILLNGQEKDKIIYEDNDKEKGFVIVQDSEWDGSSVEKMHYLAIPQKKIASLRDLNKTHLKLLEHIETTGTSKIKEKHHLSSSEFKVYIHYPPSCSHFHVHFTAIEFQKNGEHSLSTVIDNIKMVSNYYQKIRLPFVVKTRSPLGNEFREKGVI